MLHYLKILLMLKSFILKLNLNEIVSKIVAIIDYNYKII